MKGLTPNQSKCFSSLHSGVIRLIGILVYEVFGNERLLRTQVFDWFKKFKEERETIKDDPSPGRCSMSKMDRNMQKNSELICYSNSRLIVILARFCTNHPTRAKLCENAVLTSREKEIKNEHQC